MCKHFTTLALVGALCLACFSGLAAEPGPDSVQKSQTLKTRITKSVSADYLLYLPKDYNPRGSKKWPLILFLHGSGARGTNVWLVSVHGPPKIVKDKQDFPFIVVSPQCPSGQRWDDDVLLALLDKVSASHKVDVRRVYLTGLSMGGFGTWSLGLSHPERFAAIAPICGGGDTIGILLADEKKAALLKTLPVWAFHGAKDSVVKLEESEKMIAALKKRGNNATFTVYPEAQHDSWTETYNNPALYKWFLDHKR